MTEQGPEHAETSVARCHCVRVLHTQILVTGPWILHELLQTEIAAGRLRVDWLQGDAVGVRN